jgi:hypothetical protein
MSPRASSAKRVPSLERKARALSLERKKTATPTGGASSRSRSRSRGSGAKGSDSGAAVVEGAGDAGWTEESSFAGLADGFTDGPLSWLSAAQELRPAGASWKIA